MNNHTTYDIKTVTEFQELVPRYITIPSFRPQLELLKIFKVTFVTLKHYRHLKILNIVYPLSLKR
jgi:hypothetical protein